MAGFKKFTPAEKRAYWAKKNAEKKDREANRKPFIPLQNPSPYQLAVFKDVAEGIGDTIIEAVAGSGKSTTALNALTHVPEGKTVCFCAFGHDIAEELKDRCPNPNVDIATTHSFGMRSYKRRFKGASLDKFKLKNIVTTIIGDPYEDPEQVDVEKEEMIEYVCKCVSLCKQRLALDISTIEDTINYHNLDFLTESDREKHLPEEEIEIRKNEFIDHCLNAIARCKAETWTFDYDDMIFMPVVLNLPMDQFDLVIPDEVQDFNRCQMELIKRMRKPGGRIIAFGDRRQAIFLFRSADEHSIQNLITGLGAKTLPLSITYRCAKKVVEYTKSIVSGLEHLQAADTAPDGEVNLGVSFDTLREKVQPGDFIISRLNAPNVALAMHLLVHNRRCQIRGKDLGNYFKFFVKKSKCKTIPDFLDWLQKWQEDQIQMLRERKRKPTNLDGMIENINDRAGCMLTLAKDCRDVKELNEKITRLFTEDKDDQSAPKFITLGTVHRLKGMESEQVWMLNSTFKPDGGIEEQNLIYVACTRSKRILNVVEGTLRDKN